eukprot:UN15159
MLEIELNLDAVDVLFLMGPIKYTRDFDKTPEEEKSDKTTDDKKENEESATKEPMETDNPKKSELQIMLSL